MLQRKQLSTVVLSINDEAGAISSKTSECTYILKLHSKHTMYSRHPHLVAQSWTSLHSLHGRRHACMQALRLLQQNTYSLPAFYTLARAACNAILSGPTLGSLVTKKPPFWQEAWDVLACAPTGGALSCLLESGLLQAAP